MQAAIILNIYLGLGIFRPETISCLESAQILGTEQPWQIETRSRLGHDRITVTSDPDAATRVLNEAGPTTPNAISLTSWSATYVEIFKVQCTLIAARARAWF